MKVSLIVAVYKDIEALDVIVRALKDQTYKNFELIVAEDNDAEEMKRYIASIKGIEVKHTFQKDNGIQKARSLNNAILKSSGDYLIFIDGDCVPYSTFIEGHVFLSEKDTVLCGRRVNLGPKYSAFLRENIYPPSKLEKLFFRILPLLYRDGKEKHIEEGIYINPRSLFYKWFMKNRKKSIGLLGCNYSCFKKDIVNINGYDEGYGQTAIADDTDLQWRFLQGGLKMKSCKNVANIFHLYHSRTFRNAISYTGELEKMYENKKNNLFYCKNGLDTH